MNPTTSLDNKAARARPATISNDKEDAHGEILETYFFEWIDRGIGTNETPLCTLGQARETLSYAKARALGQAHPRLDRAQLHPSLRQGGLRVLAAPAFGTAANQRTFKDDQRPGRPIERAVRSVSVPSQLGGFTVRRPTFPPAPWQNIASNALNCGHCSGRGALRVLGPSAIADAAIQRSFPKSSGLVRPFFPSSLSPKTLLRAKRKGGGICFDLSSGVLGNQFRDSLNYPARQTGLSYLRGHFPGSNDRQECTFPRKSAEAGRWRSLSRHSCACQARFGGSHLFSNPPTNNRNKVYGTQTK
jgi:hypothetical protein